MSQDDIVVIVGPNNSGKSAALRGIRSKFSDPAARNPVISKLSIARQGTAEELIEWLESTTRRIQLPNQEPTYPAFGLQIYETEARNLWISQSQPLSRLGGYFCHLLTCDERLQVANPAGSIAISREAPVHPIHFLQRDDSLEAKLSQQFRKAFGLDLVVHRNAGNQVPLHVGEKPTPKQGDDRVSLSYILELEKLPGLQTQGDGMRSFAGVLLYTSVGSQSVILIDEPEAFLHPPQARYLGKMMVADKPSARQLFIATHSGDVLRGVLDSGSPKIRVIRLRRSGDINISRQLKNDRIAQLWSDPLLRYSNILDGLFHEKVVVCESDSDCRFYAAIVDSIYEAKADEERRPDLMFSNCGGKDRLPLVIRSLRELEVPLAVICDFDVISEEALLKNIVEAAGGDWAVVAADWHEVKNAVDSKKPYLDTAEVKKEILGILGSVTTQVLPETQKLEIQKVLRRSSPWSIAKTVGKAFVPNGQPSQACARLFGTLSNIGIFVVPVGELEGFARTVGGHGPGWVNEVLKKNFQTDPELQDAKTFVSQFL